MESPQLVDSSGKTQQSFLLFAVSAEAELVDAEGVTDFAMSFKSRG
jgi:hypothetical protein